MALGGGISARRDCVKTGRPSGGLFFNLMSVRVIHRQQFGLCAQLVMCASADSSPGQPDTFTASRQVAMGVRFTSTVT